MDAEPGFRDADPAAAPTAAAVPAAQDAPAVPGPVTPSPARQRSRRERDGEPGWLNSALVIGTAVFAAIALLGIWWNLRAPYVDPVPKPPGGLAVTPFNVGNNAPVATPQGASASEASTAMARAQALAAVDAAASGAAAEIAATVSVTSPPPLTASAATAALTAAAPPLPPPPPPPPPAATKRAPDEMMQLLDRRDGPGVGNGSARPTANADLPAHYDGSDPGPTAATEAQPPAIAPAASAASAATAIAAALAQCERYRWFEVIPKQRCIWAVCNGRWGKDGCPTGENPGQAR
ncbi:hypothetical protein [Pandoraea anhela]|uniref:hypothetical protein n=1 Tax=Pandoraea anhela TaxID=2508295 RepID=UPI00124151C3|nr:hypothetical protein [Pandoraea anhela]